MNHQPDTAAQLAALVRDFLDPYPCQLDHHGYCQAHTWLCSGRCPHARAREVLAGYDSASSAGVAPATDRTALRDRIRLAIARQYYDTVGSDRNLDELEPEEFASFADAVLTVLPAELLRAQAEAHQYRTALQGVARRATMLPASTGQTHPAAVPPHPPHDSWLVELRLEDGEWHVAFPTHDPATALDRLARRREEHPDHEWRLVRETVSYALEPAAAAEPADETQAGTPVHHAPGKAVLCPDCRAKGHAVCMDDAEPAAGRQTQQETPTAYSDGMGRTFCLPCATSVGADVPLTVNDVDDWELCPSCGRHVIDVARHIAEQQS
jgi:hypothetical protein